MTKNKVKIKVNLSLSDKIAITNIVVDNHFSENEVTGKVDYTPYYRELSFVNSFVGYVLEGVEFDEDDNIYELVMADEEIYDLYWRWLATKDYDQISTDVKDIVDFKKQQLIHNKKSSLDNLFDAISDVVKKMDESLNIGDISTLLPQLAKLGKNFNQEEVINQIINSISNKEKQPTTLPLSDGE